MIFPFILTSYCSVWFTVMLVWGIGDNEQNKFGMN